LEIGIRKIKKCHTEDIHIRDPFVYADHQRKKYFLFGTTFADGCGDAEPCFEVYVGEDLSNWKGPYVAFAPPEGFWGVRHYWAPEVYKYIDNKYYMFASFKGGIGECRGTGILKADKPEGPYYPHSNGPVTLKDSECLDGTLHMDDRGQPWIIFSHEWTQLYNGRIKALKLTQDLKAARGQNAIEILDASRIKWTRQFEDVRIEKRGYLTDAPFMYKTQSGVLLLLWSSYSSKGYTVAVAKSSSGSVEGPWTNDDEPLLDSNGGHPSLFRDFESNLRMCIHKPDTPHGQERADFLIVEESNGSLLLVE
jgi:arabinan endo-1,5-alpha-L-arabinosidase